jgi:hypothetical protein
MDSEHVWEVKCPSNHYWGQVTQQNVTNSPVFLNFQISRISQRKNSEFEQVPRMTSAADSADFLKYPELLLSTDLKHLPQNLRQYLGGND